MSKETHGRAPGRDRACAGRRRRRGDVEMSHGLPAVATKWVGWVKAHHEHIKRYHRLGLRLDPPFRPEHRTRTAPCRRGAATPPPPDRATALCRFVVARLP